MIRIEDLPATLTAGAPMAIQPVGNRTLKQALELPERQIILEVFGKPQLEPARDGRRPGH